MGNETIGLIGLTVALIIVAIVIGQSDVNPPFVKGGFVIGCIIGAILSGVAAFKS